MVVNRLICNMFGPMEGRRHDAQMLRESGILPILENNMNNAQAQPFSLYGDPAYPLRAHLIAPFKGANLTAAQQEFNTAV